MMTHQAPPTLPSFFKILLDPSRPQLPLPPDFVRKHLKNKISQNPILQSVNGGFSWRLKIKKVDKVYSFADGWNKVVEDTQLVFGDVLVFWLVDHSTFKVVVFGTNGCEKYFPSNIKVEHEGDDDNHNEDEEEEEEQDDDEEEEEQEEEEEDDDGSGDVHRDEVDPFFKTIISKGYKYQLWLPKEFVRLAGIDNVRIITMKNRYGEEWRLSVLPESNPSGRYYLSAGWNDFRRVNQLSEGDECVIKFIRSEDKLCLEKIKKRVGVKHPDGKVPAAEVVKRSRGRPPKREKKLTGKVPATEVMKRPIGRPPAVVVVKRSRGRPPKRMKTPGGKVPTTEVLMRKSDRPLRVEVVRKEEGAEVVKRLRGRPPKRKRGGSAHVRLVF